MNSLPLLEIFGQDMPYEERLKRLKWPTLEQGKLFMSLIECYKTTNVLNGLDPSAFDKSYNIEIHHQLQRFFYKLLLRFTKC